MGLVQRLHLKKDFEKFFIPYMALESLPMLLLSDEGIVLAANHGAINLGYWDWADLAEKPVTNLFASSDIESIERNLAAFQHKKQIKDLGQCYLLNKEGSEVSVYIYDLTTPQMINEGLRLVHLADQRELLTIKDTTARLQAQLDLINDINRCFADIHNQSAEYFLESTVNQFLNFTTCRYGFVVKKLSVDKFEILYANFSLNPSNNQEADARFLKECIQSEKLIVQENLVSSDSIGLSGEKKIYKCCYLFPLKSSGETIGALVLLDEMIIPPRDSIIDCGLAVEMFSNFLPLISHRQSNGVNIHSYSKPEIKLQKRALIVEDMPLNQDVARLVLEQEGYVSDIVNNGMEALHLLRQNKNQYDFILMDCQMPILDGFESTKQIIQMSKNGILKHRPPIIALTAYATSDIRNKCLDVGMDDVLTKPLQIDQLKQSIGNLRIIKAI